MEPNRIVSRDEWLVARKAHLAREKELTRLRDQVSAERRELPWVKVEKDYVFDGPDGKETLADLFDGRSQLIVYHVNVRAGMDGRVRWLLVPRRPYRRRQHDLAHHDASLVAVSRAPLVEFGAFKKRMGWRFKWVSSYGSDFNYDFHVTSDEAVTPVEYNYRSKAELLQRGEPWFTEGENHGASVFYKDTGRDVFHWVRHHDRYDDVPAEDSCCGLRKDHP